MNAGPPLRIAVIGVGHLGRHHARILAALPGVTLAGVCDTDAARARQVASDAGCEIIGDLAALPGLVDAVTIAVPTEAHARVALPLVERGIPVLLEKPLARSLDEADAILAAAERSGALVAAGHTERFNPAVEAARPLLRKPRFVEVHRLGAFPDRSLDIDVVFDLMIHDLDVVLSVVESEVAAVDAVGVPVLSPRIDIANVRLRFQSGCIANLTASRISRERVRKIRFFQHDSYVSIDYTAQELEVWRLVRSASGPPSIEGGKLPVTQGEPLQRELADFVEAVKHRRQPGVPGIQGRRALALADQIMRAMTVTSDATATAPQ
jgi:predicted dehydrogenase